jgi:hypothetical protein
MRGHSKRPFERFPPCTPFDGHANAAQRGIAALALELCPRTLLCSRFRGEGDSLGSSEERLGQGIRPHLRKIYPRWNQGGAVRNCGGAWGFPFESITPTRRTGGVSTPNPVASVPPSRMTCLWPGMEKVGESLAFAWGLGTGESLGIMISPLLTVILVCPPPHDPSTSYTPHKADQMLI